MKNIIISPSLLACDFTNLAAEIAKAEESGAEWLHYDVMDGHFVNNISFGLPIVEQTSKIHHMVNDVHIMISNPLKYAKRFCQAGADIVTFHYEACVNKSEIYEIIDEIHACGKKAGLSIKPFTEVEEILPLLTSLDLVLVMSVEPGFGGQKFNSDAIYKIAKLRKVIDDNNYKTIIQVDGGINADTAERCIIAGVDCLVAGTYLFGHDDFKDRVTLLKQIKQ